MIGRIGILFVEIHWGTLYIAVGESAPVVSKEENNQSVGGGLTIPDWTAQT
jgi:hypothetical protein